MLFCARRFSLLSFVWVSRSAWQLLRTRSLMLAFLELRATIKEAHPRIRGENISLSILNDREGINDPQTIPIERMKTRYVIMVILIHP
jgi:hypothetical protein